MVADPEALRNLILAPILALICPIIGFKKNASRTSKCE